MSEDPQKDDAMKKLTETASDLISKLTGKAPEVVSEIAEGEETKTEPTANKGVEKNDGAKEQERDAAWQVIVDKYAPNAQRMVEGLDTLRFVPPLFMPVQDLSRLELSVMFGKAKDVSEQIIYTVYGKAIGDELINSARGAGDDTTDMFMSSEGDEFMDLISRYNPVDDRETTEELAGLYRSAFVALDSAMSKRRRVVLMRYVELLTHSAVLFVRARYVTITRLREKCKK